MAKQGPLATCQVGRLMHHLSHWGKVKNQLNIIFAQTRIQQRRLRPGAEFCHDEVFIILSSLTSLPLEPHAILSCSIILAKQIANFVTTILIFIDQADDTLLTEQRNLLDLINKLEGGLGQVETQICCF